MKTVPPADILILSNGPGEVTTWVFPVVRALRQQLDASQVRISVVLSPCPHGTGKEAAIARSYPEVNRVQGQEYFWPFLLWGKTADNWGWHRRGVVLFLGGDQFYAVLLGKRLGYAVVVYAEWEARWFRWVDRFALRKESVVVNPPAQYRHKFTVVGDLMSDVGEGAIGNGEWASADETGTELIGLLPGSKAAKLAQGVPLSLAIAEQIYRDRPQTRFIIPVAPTLDIYTLAKFADPTQNPVLAKVDGASADLVVPRAPDQLPFLKTADGLRVDLIAQFPAYPLLLQCRLCLTTVGANTAQLGALGVPMIVLLPTQQLDAMRSWDGIPGILANLPGVGTALAKLINGTILKQGHLFAWPNKWANQEIVPELVGKLRADDVAQLVIEFLKRPDHLEAMRNRLLQVRGKPGAASRISAIVCEQLKN